MNFVYKPPKRLISLKESATLKAAELAKKMEKQGTKVIHLDLGEPDFTTPKPIIEACYKALNAGYTHYSPSVGLPELRDAVSDKLQNENNLDIKY